MYGYKGPLKPNHAIILKTLRPTLNTLRLAALMLFTFACAPDESALPVQLSEPNYWLHEDAQLHGEIPPGWSLTQSTDEAWHFNLAGLPNHTLSIQRLTVDTGRGALKLLKQALKKHPYFADFEYNLAWETRTDTVWAPAYHATYLYLNQPALRYGTLIPTKNGYYEISYHASMEPAAIGITGYEYLVDSITIVSND